MSGRGRARAPPTKGTGPQTTTRNYPAPKVSAPPPTTPELIRRYEARFLNERMSAKMEVPRLGSNFRRVAAAADNLRDVADPWDGLVIEQTPKLEEVVAKCENWMKMTRTTTQNGDLTPNCRQFPFVPTNNDFVKKPRVRKVPKGRCIFDLGPKTPTLAAEEVLKPKEGHVTPKESSLSPKSATEPEIVFNGEVNVNEAPVSPKLGQQAEDAVGRRHKCTFDEVIKAKDDISMQNEGLLMPKLAAEQKVVFNRPAFSPDLKPAPRTRCIFDFGPKSPNLSQGVVANGINEIKIDDKPAPNVKIGDEVDGSGLKSTETIMETKKPVTHELLLKAEAELRQTVSDVLAAIRSMPELDKIKFYEEPVSPKLGQHAEDAVGRRQPSTFDDGVKPKEGISMQNEGVKTPKLAAEPKVILNGFQKRSFSHDLKPAQRLLCIFDLGPKTPLGVRCRRNW